jgi:D-sedoheptulose 7-phosphate isomerase
MQDVIKSCIDDAVSLTSQMHEFAPQLESFSARVLACLQQGGKLMFCGNGGSACDGAHIAGEFPGRFSRERGPYPAMALAADSGLLTCIANDYDYASVFARQIGAYGKPGDILIAMTTSGNSPNIVQALDAAEAAGVATVAMLGKGGGLAKGKADIEFIIPSTTTARIQEAHKLLLHIMCEIVDRGLA